MDRGELDKIIEKSNAGAPMVSVAAQPPSFAGQRHDNDRRYEKRRYDTDRRNDDDDDDNGFGGCSFLEQLFD